MPGKDLFLNAYKIVLFFLKIIQTHSVIILRKNTKFRLK